MRERRWGSLAAEAALSNLSAAFRNWPALTAFPRLLFERLRALLGEERGAHKKEDPGRREEHAHPHPADCSYSFFRSIAGRT